MYKDHPIFPQPENENIKVWRYIDFAKFVSMLDSKSLFFARLDKLGDPFEGSWPKPNILERNSIEKFLKALPAKNKQEVDLMAERTPRLHRTHLKYHAANCWHMNDVESAAMWNLYLKSNEGVAVQSTYKKLKDSFVDSRDIFFGMVTYKDYEHESIGNAALSPFVHKRKSFEHENEVRALISQYPSDATDMFREEKLTMAEGVAVLVNIESLIEKIFVAPIAQTWFLNMVESVAKKYGYAFNVMQSKLDDDPLF